MGREGSAVSQGKYGIKIHISVKPGILPTLQLIKLVHFFTDSLSTSYNLKINQKSMNFIKKLICIQ